MGRYLEMHSLKFHMQEADSLAAVRNDLFSHEAAGADSAAVQLQNCISQFGPVVIQTGKIGKQHGFGIIQHDVERTTKSTMPQSELPRFSRARKPHHERVKMEN